jgi:hypothetical protein
MCSKMRYTFYVLNVSYLNMYIKVFILYITDFPWSLMHQGTIIL